MANANAIRQRLSRGGPATDRCKKAAVVSSFMENPSISPGAASAVVRIASPVSAQITTVSQKVAVMEIKACVWGLGVSASAAAMAAVPSPASFVNSPRVTP